ncbi:hypothetical protein ACN27J_09560 [Solwaraspora sp. WMMB762]|uniref:hypothetical protein n=1 Tax=Solwaraspora sp. WMMB762 TaxID=3404120 RepID=UPI003B9569F1
MTHHLGWVRTRPNADIAPWLRAVYWQFVHQDQRQAIAELRRRSATARGMHARPERDLTTARWAAPLAADPVGLDLLISFVIGLRDQVADSWRIPHATAKHGLTDQQVRLRLTAAVDLLRRINPSFYEANVAAALHRRADRLDPCDDLPGARPIHGTVPGDPAERYADPGDTPQRRRRARCCCGCWPTRSYAAAGCRSCSPRCAMSRSNGPPSTWRSPARDDCVCRPAQPVGDWKSSRSSSPVPVSSGWTISYRNRPDSPGIRGVGGPAETHRRPTHSPIPSLWTSE